MVRRAKQADFIAIPPIITRRGGASRRHPFLIPLDAEAETSLDREVVRGLPVGRYRMVLAEQAHPGLRGDREAYAGAHVGAELGIAPVHAPARVELDLALDVVESASHLREERRADRRAKVDAERGVDPE